VCYPLRCHAMLLVIHRMLQEKLVYNSCQLQVCSLPDPQNALVQRWRTSALPCAAHCCQTRMLCARKGAGPLRPPCKLVAHDPQNVLVEEGTYALPCKLVARSHRMPAQEGCAIPALPCKPCCCHDPQNAWWKKCYPCAAMQARCCCDSECPGRCAIPCHACKLLL
jgi:hypothetical protein